MVSLRLLPLLCAAILTAQTVNYQYDQAGRLIAVVYPGGTTATYTYDASGNMLRKTVAATGTGTAPVVNNPGVVNAASEQNNQVAPGEIVTIYGTGIGPSPVVFTGVTPANAFDTLTGNTTVTFDGISAATLYASALQTSVVVPYSVNGQSSTQLVVTYLGVSSAPQTLTVVPAAPGLFSADLSGKGQGAIINQDGSGNSPSNPAPRGSVITLYETGEGQTNPRGVDGRLALSVLPKPVLPLKVTLGGVDVSSGVTYAGGAPGYVAGLTQINVQVPQNAATGAVPVVVTFGSASSQSGITVSLK